MSARITLQPSGKQFSAETGENILAAALRAGLNLQYNCKNGSCGVCAAELLQGEVVKSQNHDYKCKPSAEGNPRFLMCCHQARSDLQIRATEVGNSYDLPFQSIETRVYRNDMAENQIRILQLRTPRSKSLQFLAGQYVTLEIDGLPPRNKSIASCPCNGMYLHFHINRAQDDPFARYVFDELKPKQKVMVNGPSGQFTLDDDSKRPILLIANGTGFAPIKSLIEHAIDLELAQDIQLYWIMPTGETHYLANYCHSWEDALDNFRYTALHFDCADNDGADSAPQSLLLQAAQAISREHPDLHDYDVYINGPRQHASGLIEHLLAHGLDAQRLFIDRMKRY